MNITKSEVDKLPIPEKLANGQTGQKKYYDDKLKGFGVRVTSGGAKTFFVEKIIKSKLRRIKIGRYGELTVEQARKQAHVLLGQIASGIDPIAEQKEAKAKAVTLSQTFEDYLNARKSLKSTTIFDYQRVMKEAFADWLNKPLLNINKDMIAKRHTKLGETSHARSNLAMRVLRALFNFAAGEYEDAKGQSLILENPVKRLSHTRAWYRVERRQTVIKSYELAQWYKGLQELHDLRSSGKSAIIRDYLLFILLTGLRRNEAARLRWKDVDLKHKTITIGDTKNHQKHILPLSDYLYELLKRRSSDSLSDYVFPGVGKEGFIIEPRKVMDKVIKSSGVSFTLHDLRRTFITVAESLDIPAYALKRLLNHKSNNDVTAGYIIIDVERLRKPMQMITDNILKHLGVIETANVLEFKGHLTHNQ